MRGPKTVDKALNRLINLAARRTADLRPSGFWRQAHLQHAAAKCQSGLDKHQQASGAAHHYGRAWLRGGGQVTRAVRHGRFRAS